MKKVRTKNAINKPVITIFFLAFFLLSTAGMCQRDKEPTDLGFHKSVDGGKSYQQKNKISDEENLNSTSVIGIEIDEFDPSFIIIGTRLRGIYRSEDAGENWQKTSQGNGTFYNLAIDPKNNRTVFASGIIDNIGRILKSTDGGKEWTEVYRETHEGTAVYDIEVDFYDTRNIYACTERGAFMKSEDNGRSWVVKNWFPGSVDFIDVSPHDSRNIYVLGSSIGLSRTKNAGETFEEVKFYKPPKEDKTEVKNEVETEDKEGAEVLKDEAKVEDENPEIKEESSPAKEQELEEYENAKMVFDLEFHPQNKDIFFVASKFGLLKTENEGATWTPVNLLVPQGENSIIRFVVDNKDPKNIFLALDTSIYTSRDGGAHWETNKITDKFVDSIVIDPENSQTIYVGIWNKNLSQ